MDIMCLEVRDSILRAKAIVIAENFEKARISLVNNGGDLWKVSKKVWSYSLRESNKTPVIVEIYM